MGRLIVAIGVAGLLATVASGISGYLGMAAAAQVQRHAVLALVGLLLTLFCQIWLVIYGWGCRRVAVAAAGAGSAAATAVGRYWTALGLGGLLVAGLTLVTFWTGVLAYARDVAAWLHHLLAIATALAQATGLVLAHRRLAAMEEGLDALEVVATGTP